MGPMSPMPDGITNADVPSLPSAPEGSSATTKAFKEQRQQPAWRDGAEAPGRPGMRFWAVGLVGWPPLEKLTSGPRTGASWCRPKTAPPALEIGGKARSGADPPMSPMPDVIDDTRRPLRISPPASKSFTHEFFGYGRWGGWRRPNVTQGPLRRLREIAMLTVVEEAVGCRLIYAYTEAC
jgi:hypothetical protein